MPSIQPENQYLHLFAGYGVELEYMIVDRQTLNIRSLADKVLASVAGPWRREAQCGSLAWSNELVLHVIELKTNGPASSLAGLHPLFQQDVFRINELLAPLDACLMPTAMHPWMNPDAEAALWQQEDKEIYSALDRIFCCMGHGWKNLQSAHLNLPFYDDGEFVKLHAAIRLVLPLIPAIAASSPFIDGSDNGILDNRLIVYQQHCRRLPQAMGPVIPESVDSIEHYHAEILEPIYQALKPHDPQGILAYEWINARGAITRFDRQTIEIRLIDMQECPLADLAVAWAVAGAVQRLIDTNTGGLNAIPSETLRTILQLTICDAEQAVIEEVDFLRQLGINETSVSVRAVWRHLVEPIADFVGPERDALETILEHGTLASRMKKAAAQQKNDLFAVYRQLAQCLADGGMLIP